MAILAFKGNPGSYDEVYGPDGGVRAAYATLGRRLGADLLRPAAATVERLRDRPLGDDARILPVPWVLDGPTHRSVVGGAHQRALALQRFFADVAIGPMRVAESGRGLTPALLDAILGLEGMSVAGLRRLWAGHSPEEVRFVYGPDLVRGPDGRWFVLEDNVGCIGGSADSWVVWDVYLDALGAPRGTEAARPDLQVAVARWLDRLGVAAGDGVVVVDGCEAGGEEVRSVAVHENARRRQLLAPLGVEAALACGPSDNGANALLNFEAGSELVDSAFRQGTPLFNAPGTGILGNKALLPYVDGLIRFFCDEEPLLATPATRILEGGELPSAPEEWVVKSAAGCQGTEVFVLRSQPPERVEAVRDLVRDAWPKAWFVAQRYVEPSHLPTGGPGGWGAYEVELRPVTYVVGWSELVPSTRPSGKAVSRFDVRRLHNVSQGACYVPVAVAEGGL